MAIRRVRLDTDEILRKTSRDVVTFDDKLHVLIDDMIETMDKGEGVGLAAPQVGVLKRLFVIHEEDDEPLVFINPSITYVEGEQENAEACLSLPNRQGMVKRPSLIRIHSQDRYGKHFNMEADDVLAVAICHENDHLDGVLYTDKAVRMLTKEEMEAAERADRRSRRAKMKREHRR